MFKHFILTAALLATLTLTSCGTDEPETPDAPSDNTEQPGSTPGDTPDTGGEEPGADEPSENPITINADGSNSAGVPFRRIDGSTFWLNHVQYKILGGHIAVTDSDEAEIGQTLKGKVSIYSPITIDGATYKVRTIEQSAFYDCSSLISIVLPESIIFIHEFAFNSCHRLKYIMNSFKLL